MTIINISLLLLVSLLPLLTFTADVGIENGHEVRPHSRPYMVSVQVYGHHRCGGFLITRQFVVTAAQCWHSHGLTVVVGAHDLRRNSRFNRFGVRSYIPHPQYNRYTFENDILLLKLKRKVRLNRNVRLISLPRMGQNVAADTHCSVAGWGRRWTDGPTSNRLLETKTLIVNDRECKRRWGSHFVASKMICAYGHGGSCNGDGGGPLVCRGVAVGITAYRDRYRCNSRLLPNVYTKISKYVPWIRRITGNA